MPRAMHDKGNACQGQCTTRVMHAKGNALQDNKDEGVEVAIEGAEGEEG